MLFYATILIASMITAVVVLFLYEVISNSSRSVYRSKDRIATISRVPRKKKSKARNSAVASTFSSIDRGGSVAQWGTEKSTPAMPVGNSGLSYQVPGQLATHGAGAANVNHYGYAGEPQSNHTRNAGWLSREEKCGPGGDKVYKVKRNSAPRSTDF